MTTPLTGYTNTFPDDVVIDSGVLYLGGSVFAALRGGLRFDPGIELRNIEFDGKRIGIAELDRVTKRTPKISGTMIELPFSAVQDLEPGGSSGTGWSGGAAYFPRKAAALFTSGMYLDNVRAIWLRGNGALVSVRFPKGLIVKSGPMTSQDADELATEIEVEARVDLSVGGSTPGDAGYVIEYLDIEDLT